MWYPGALWGALCGMLCAYSAHERPTHTALGVAKHIEPPTYTVLEITKFVEVPTKVIIGIPATPLIIPTTLSAAPSAQARSPITEHRNGYQHTKTHAHFDAAGALTAFGHWANEPTLSPFQLFQLFALVGFLATFCLALQDTSPRHTMDAIAHDLGQTFHVNSIAMWTVISWIAHYIAYPVYTQDPMNWAVPMIIRQAETHGATYFVATLRRVTAPLERHCGQGYSILRAIWLILAPALVKTADRVNIRLQEILPEFAAILLNNAVAIIDFAYKCMRRILHGTSVVLGVVWHWVVCPAFFCLWFSVQYIGTYQAMVKWRTEIRFRMSSIIDTRYMAHLHDGDALRLKAARMTKEETVELLQALASKNAQMDQLRSSSQHLGKKCIAYRRDLKTQIEHVNFFRRFIDTITNHCHNQKFNTGLFLEEPFKSSRIVFLANANDQGFHFGIDPTTVRDVKARDVYPMEHHLKKDLVKRNIVKRGPTASADFRHFTFNADIITRGLSRTFVDLFNDCLWPMEVFFENIRLPKWDPKSNPFTAAGLVADAPETLTREEDGGETLEDYAARDELAHWSSAREEEARSARRARIEAQLEAQERARREEECRKRKFVLPPHLKCVLRYSNTMEQVRSESIEILA